MAHGHPRGQAEEFVDLAHPAGVAACQVVVDGDDVHPFAGQRVQVGRQRGHQRLALAGTHLGDLALVQHHAADQLHVVMAHAERAHGRLAHRGEGLRQQVVEALALAQPLAEFIRPGAQRLVRKLLEPGFQIVDAGNYP